MDDKESASAQFETDEDRSHFVIRLPIHTQAIPSVATPKVTPQVTPQVQQVLEACDGDLDRNELQTRVKITDRKYFRTDYLRPALDQHLIEMTIPDKPQSSKQRYRLTAAGRQWLTQHEGTE